MKKKTLLTTVVFLGMFCFSAVVFAATQVKLDKKTRTEIEKTLAVMANNFPKSFSISDLSNKDLIQFGISNAEFIPKPGQRYADGSYLLKAKYVEEAVAKYFNRLVEHESLERSPYRNGVYKVNPGESGEGSLIKITRVEKINDQSIMVYADNLDPDTKKLFRKERAILQKVKEDGKAPRYVVDVYQILK